MKAREGHATAASLTVDVAPILGVGVCSLVSVRLALSAGGLSTTLHNWFGPQSQSRYEGRHAPALGVSKPTNG